MTAISIIGAGRHGTAIASLFAAHGVDVTLFHKKPERLALAQRTVTAAAAHGATISVASTLEEAVDAAQVVALTTLWDAPQREVLDVVRDRLVGHVVLDVSNPLDVTPAGISMRRPAEGSAGQFFATLLAPGTGHGKAFSNLATATIGGAADKTPPAVMAYLADGAATAETMRDLLGHTGWQPWYVGDISHSRDLEIGGKYNDVHGRWGRSALDASEFEAKFGPERFPTA